VDCFLPWSWCNIVVEMGDTSTIEGTVLVLVRDFTSSRYDHVRVKVFQGFSPCQSNRPCSICSAIHNRSLCSTWRLWCYCLWMEMTLGKGPLHSEKCQPVMGGLTVTPVVSNLVVACSDVLRSLGMSRTLTDQSVTIKERRRHCYPKYQLWIILLLQPLWCWVLVSHLENVARPVSASDVTYSW
jgi:hypothetical protein